MKKNMMMLVFVVISACCQPVDGEIVGKVKSVSAPRMGSCGMAVAVTVRTSGTHGRDVTFDVMDPELIDNLVAARDAETPVDVTLVDGDDCGRLAADVVNLSSTEM